MDYLALVDRSFKFGSERNATDCPPGGPIFQNTNALNALTPRSAAEDPDPAPIPGGQGRSPGPLWRSWLAALRDSRELASALTAWELSRAEGLMETGDEPACRAMVLLAEGRLWPVRYRRSGVAYPDPDRGLGWSPTLNPIR